MNRGKSNDDEGCQQICISTQHLKPVGYNVEMSISEKYPFKSLLFQNKIVNYYYSCVIIVLQEHPLPGMLFLYHLASNAVPTRFYSIFTLVVTHYENLHFL